MAKKRKTREEKIRASLRRQLVASDGQAAQPASPTGGFQAPTFTLVKREFEAAQAQTNSLASEEEKQEKTAQTETLASTILDLRKTFLIASLIFLAELVLYWLWK